MNLPLCFVWVLLFCASHAIPSLALAQEKVRFPIGASSKTFSYGPLWLGQKLGYFEREGLDVQIVVMRGTPITIQALATESIYVANVGTDGVIGAVDKGLDLAMVGSLLNNLSMSLVAAKPYKTFDDLRGKTIGSQTITTGTGFAMRLVLRAHGLEYPRDYQILNVGGVTDRYIALQSGQIAATPLSVPLDIVGQAAGIQRARLFCRRCAQLFFEPVHRQAFVGRKKPPAGGALHEGDSANPSLAVRQPRRRLWLSVEGNVDDSRELPHCLGI